MTYTTYLGNSGSGLRRGRIPLLGVANDPLVALLPEVEENIEVMALQAF
jgi:hypothetical protein